MPSIAAIWFVTGLVLTVAVVLFTGLIPFVVPGLIVVVCGSTVYVLSLKLKLTWPWWLLLLLIVLLSAIVTLFLIPDTRHWVIARIVLAFYFVVALVASFFSNIIRSKGA